LRRPFLMVGHPFVEDSITTPIRRREDGLFHSLRGALRCLLPLATIRPMLPDCEWCTKRIDREKVAPYDHVNTGVTIASILSRPGPSAAGRPLDTYHPIGPKGRPRGADCPDTGRGAGRSLRWGPPAVTPMLPHFDVRFHTFLFRSCFLSSFRPWRGRVPEVPRSPATGPTSIRHPLERHGSPVRIGPSGPVATPGRWDPSRRTSTSRAKAATWTAVVRSVILSVRTAPTAGRAARGLIATSAGRESFDDGPTG
jgi:hypothetical protein